MVKIKEGVPGSEAGEKLIKSIVNMVCLRTGENYCMLNITLSFFCCGHQSGDGG